MNAHGVSVMEIRRGAQGWRVVNDFPLNRRITLQSPMDITGPGRGHDLLKTQADPQAVVALGTFNNCGNGRTPWGTYLTCEENFHIYFHSPSNPDWTPQPRPETLRLQGRQRPLWLGHGGGAF
ncbi:alkaline phosphatase PhoX [Candidatus Synechococcus spongiarum]|uniref:Putative phosphatase n=1 Tax=Candidatus Synechococcus spongiarum TaxID=431041 RepID=A0A164YZB5_9SYNE|nr:alkaline phosphatase PhoX [Candidatus Synechococcus spongiarum]SAY39497.1 Putative phosphatase [Candidatus Synechococcus spongiarum]